MLLFVWRFSRRASEIPMRVAGFLLLLSGWMLVFAALALLRAGGTRGLFVLAGLGVEIVGLVLAFRSHLTVKDNRDRS